MDLLRIGIGSDDGQTLAGSHLGDTESFLVYDIARKGESIFIERRANTVRDMGHASGDKMKAVLAILHDIDVLVASKNSPNFRRIAAKTAHQPAVVHREQASEAIELLVESYDRLAALVGTRRSGQRDGVVLELP